MGVTKWNDEFYVYVYMRTLSGMSEASIATSLGVEHNTFVTWKKQRPALRKALEMGKPHKGKRTGTNEFVEFCASRMPPDLQDIWDRLMLCQDSEDVFERTNAILDAQPKHVRQHLFVYSLIACNFNVSEAMRKINLTHKTYDNWRQDPEFADLMAHVKTCREDFFEGHFMGAAAAGNAGVLVHAARTILKDRGYAEPPQRTENEHKHVHQHNVAPPVDLLSLLASWDDPRATTTLESIIDMLAARERGEIADRQPVKLLTHQETPA